MTRKMRPYRTEHQREIMGTVLREFYASGRLMTQQELFDALEYPKTTGVSFGAVRKSVQLLEAQGMVERVKDPALKKIVVHPTTRGADWFRAL